MEVQKIDLVKCQNLVNLLIVLVFLGVVEGFFIFVEEFFLISQEKVCVQSDAPVKLFSDMR